MCVCVVGGKRANNIFLLEKCLKFSLNLAFGKGRLKQNGYLRKIDREMILALSDLEGGRRGNG